jgi:hypothetical protein
MLLFTVHTHQQWTPSTIFFLAGSAVHSVCLIYVAVSGTNFTYELTSMQNRAHIYVGTISLLVSNNSVTKVAILELKIDPLKIVFIKF